MQAHRRLAALAASASAKASAKAEGPTNETPYADSSTVAYSMVLSPRSASIYVHWAEVTKKQVIYHMHCAGAYAIERDKGLKECRAAVNNILDWGLSERRKAIVGLLHTLYERYKDTTKGAKGKGKGVEDQPPANKKHRMEEEGGGQ